MITIERRTAQHADLRQLIGELDEDLLLRYPPELIHGLDLDHPDVAEITFMVAYVDGEPAGCGAIRKLDAYYAELKRFFVRAAQRRNGIATGLLKALESAPVSKASRGYVWKQGLDRRKRWLFMSVMDISRLSYLVNISVNRKAAAMRKYSRIQ